MAMGYWAAGFHLCFSLWDPQRMASALEERISCLNLARTLLMPNARLQQVLETLFF